MTDLSRPPGIRNNNPGNIRFDGTKWRGLIGDDGAFCIFDTPENGVRAIARILLKYQARTGSPGMGGNGLDTIREIISRWAPPTENNTESYILSVAKSLGVTPETALKQSQWPGLIKGIIRHENGEQPYSDETIVSGIVAAM